ncbi:MAG: hypothetical protein J5732_04315 [Bacteroidaceae bacterium]|nr:hypothetical protein [Bacteroidaceae bacterium]
MPKKSLSLLPLLLSSLLVLSCVKEAGVQSPESVVTNFQIGDFYVLYHDITVKGHDTLVTRKVTGATIKYAIDQMKGLIYNEDPLPAGSIIDKVTTSVSGTGTVYWQKSRADGTLYDTIWSSKDTVDMTKPLKLLSVSEDGSFRRLYTVMTNISTADPDSMSWKEVPSLPVRMSGIKAVELDGRMIVIGDSLGIRTGVTSLSVGDGDSWSDFESCKGLSNPVKWTISVHSGSLYIVDGESLKMSDDGVNWTDVGQDTPMKALVPFNQTGDGGTSIGITEDGWIASSEDMTEWTKLQRVPDGFPETDIVGMMYPLKSNPAIERFVIMGNDGNGLNTSTIVWTRLSTEKEWSLVEVLDANSLRCPVFSDPSFILYDGSLFAFGGIASLGDIRIESLGGFYQSLDNGISWRYCNPIFDTYNTWNNCMQIPAQLKGCVDPICGAVDTHNDIWIITGGSKGVWKGHINRLYR